ncbi:hypothetical protein ACFTZB_00870 [Rhodococcus sp. NPDC057014]|uniref:hypothetical protein n=1 Tax=Rhodococcus sp. NPDC057014 TaxID=3346000 RepID=UPI003630ECD6
MNRYIEKQVRFFEEIDEQIASTMDPRHQAILRTYMWHAAFELCGEVDSLFAPDMMVDNPVYKILGLGTDTLQVHRGKESVRKRFYENLNEAIVLAYDETRAVADWGLAFFCTVGTVVTAQQLAATGHAVDDPTATYLIEHFCGERWPFDDRARLVGEEVYQIGDPVISKLAPEDVFTVEERNAAVRRFLPTASALSS